MIVSGNTTLSRTQADEFVFTSLADCKREKLPIVKKVFNDVMSPFYGEQAAVVKDIEDRKERKTEILSHNKKDVGCIIYKRELTGDKQFEITLSALVDPAQDAKKGYRTKLVERIEEIAKELRAESIVYKLPTNLVDHVQYFEHKGFTKTNIQDSQECLLTKQLEHKRRRVKEAPRQAPPAVRNQELTLKYQYIDPIRRGVKTIEGRINSGGPKNFKVNDTLRLYSGQNSVTCTISKIERFSSFREMLEKTDFKKCIPDAQSLEAAVRVYDSIKGYAERARQNGVLAIHLTNPH